MSQDNADIPDDVAAALTECEQEVDHLKRENHLLREASRSFGALAERLNESLASERRQGHERRAAPRGTRDRRHAAAVADAEE